MTTYKELKDEFDKNVKELQNNCDHSDVSDWMDSMWAPGHFDLFKVKVCSICNKIIDKKNKFPYIEGINNPSQEDFKKILKMFELKNDKK